MHNAVSMLKSANTVKFLVQQTWIFKRKRIAKDVVLVSWEFLWRYSLLNPGMWMSGKLICFLVRIERESWERWWAVNFAAMNLALQQQNKCVLYPSFAFVSARSFGNSAVQIVCFTLQPEKMHVTPAKPYFYDRILFSLNFSAPVWKRSSF